MTAPPTPDEMRVAEEIVTNWITRCDNLPEIRFEQSWVLLHIIAAALSTTAAQAEASGMRMAAAIARNFRDGNPEAWDSVATTGNRIAAAILASGLQTTPPAAPAEDKEND
jgi:hypothetical protein